MLSKVSLPSLSQGGTRVLKSSSTSVMVTKRTLKDAAIGVLRERVPGEARVSLVPQHVSQLVKRGAKVRVEKDAGALAGYTDAQYASAGAETLANPKDVVEQSNVLVTIHAPKPDLAPALAGKTLVGLLKPLENKELIDALVSSKARAALSLDMLLRTLSRGQAFDVLSSQANIAGYKAVMEAAHALQRPFAGQSTAAGKIEPTRVIVVGAGVAGLQAIQTAKALGAIVSAFDVRSAAKEQVEAVGAKFLSVETTETGDGAGGYAKEMSPEWFDAAAKMLLKECAKTNVIITTALIPGKKAPVLITKEMVEAMPQFGVVVDLAAEAGGNVATTKPNEVVTIPSNGVKCVGYTNLPSRMASVSSQLFSGNVSKLLLSMEDKKTNNFVVDENDDAVRSMLVVKDGSRLEPFKPKAAPAPAAAKPAAAAKGGHGAGAKKVLSQSEVMAQSLYATGGMGTAVALGARAPDASSMAVLALSVWVGSQAVRGVAHSLHSPLMSITNAISGMTIVGGMLQMGGGLLPHSAPQGLATSAVVLSSINLTGGFLVTRKMLAMFRRKDDPPEYWSYLLLPPAVCVAGLGLMPDANFAQSVAIASGLGCIYSINQMSKQETSRLAVVAGMGGVGMGVAATLAQMAPASPMVYAQLAGASALGGGLGYQIASKVGPTELPQAVAGFHSLVGVAAASTAIGDFLVHGTEMDGFHSSSIYLGSWMGGVTATGSVIAYGKLSEQLSAKPLNLPNRDALNAIMAGGSALSMIGFVGASDPFVAGSFLATGTALSGLLGLHMTASIGGADMPVVITLLNSYSGWALCAEGAILNQPILTIVGALIGSSGAFLTKVMCDSMNRSLAAVILGGFGTESGAVQTSSGLVHKEVDTTGAAAALNDASTVVIVPGYGLAVAQAQGVVADIASSLIAKGKDVRFAVHPVAGRMPGQLNVLLAEAGVPYDRVFELEDINPVLPNTDVVVVVGANDTVNSAAEDDPKSAIAGMPIIQVNKAKHVIFMKRSMASGYAGVDNPVFYHPATDMLLGDAKKSLEAIRSKL